MNETRKTKQETTKRPIMKVVAFYVGLAMMIASALLLVLGVMIPGFSVKTELHNHEFDFNFSFFLYVGLLFGGLVIASFYFKKVSLQFSREPPWKDAPTKITSVPWTRFLAGGILVVLAVVSYSLLGIGFSDADKIGLWLYLGGPSSFFPTGLSPLIIGIVLLLYAPFATKVIDVERDGGLLNITERRLGSKITTMIPRDKILSARLTNTRIGPRHIWNAVFFFQIWLLYVDGLSFLLNPHVFGTGFLVGSMYVISASVQLVCLALLVLGKRCLLEIITDENIYEMKFEPVGKMARKVSLLRHFLGEEPETRESKDASGNGRLMPPRTFTRLVAGLVFIGVAVIGRVAQVYTSEIMRLGLVFAGTVLLTEAFKKDVSKGKLSASVHAINGGPGKRISSTRGSQRDEIVLNTPSNGREATSQPSVIPRKLEITDHLVAMFLPLIFGYEMTQSFLLAASGINIIILMAVFQGIIGVVMILLVALVTVDPRPMVEINAGIKRYQVFIQSVEECSSGGFIGINIPGAFKQLLNRWKSVFSNKRRTVVNRLLEIMIFTAIGVILTITMYYT
ncbi:MAG: hypothetical protein ACFFCS_13260 [Candidatus Hodarchaeota archaeon]